MSEVSLREPPHPSTDSSTCTASTTSASNNPPVVRGGSGGLARSGRVARSGGRQEVRGKRQRTLKADRVHQRGNHSLSNIWHHSRSAHPCTSPLARAHPSLLARKTSCIGKGARCGDGPEASIETLPAGAPSSARFKRCEPLPFTPTPSPTPPSKQRACRWGRRETTGPSQGGASARVEWISNAIYLRCV